MKSTLKKTLISVAVALVFAIAAVVSGVLLLTNRDNSSGTPASSLADSQLTTPSKLDVTASTDKIVPGGSITLTFTFSSRPNRVWYAGEALIMPLDSSGNPDGAMMAYFTWDDLKTPVDLETNMTLKGEFQDYKPAIVDKSASTFAPEDRGLYIMFARGQVSSIGTNTSNFVFQATLKIANDILTNNPSLATTGLKFGLVADALNGITTIPNASSPLDVEEDYAEEGNFSMTDLTFGVRDKNDNAIIEKIVLGVGSATDSDLTINNNGVVTPDPATYVYEFDTNGDVTIYLPDSSEKKVSINYPTMETGSEGAKVEAGISADIPTAPSAWTEVGTTALDVTVEPDSNVIHIKTTPETENATNVKNYTITCVFTYVRLDTLTVATTLDASLSGVTNNGFKDPATYDKDTYAYDVYVPGDKTTITPTVVADYGASTDVALAVSGSCTVLTSPVNSGDPFDVENIADGDTITLTVTAAGGYPNTNTHTYTLTFFVVSTDIDFEIVVKGAISGNEFNNNSDKATAENVDYYYRVTEADPSQSLMLLTAATGAKIQVATYTNGIPGTYVDYSSSTLYNPDSYIIKVTAEAGNYEEYKVMLVKVEVLNLDPSSTYNFITLQTGTPASRKYRRSYSQIGWTHGVDDIDNPDIQKIVLGDIPAMTSVETLITNFDSTQLSKVCIYNNNGDTIVNNGVVDSSLTNNQKRVATGWKIEYGTGSNKDVIYVSILGDVNGDARTNVTDIATLNNYFSGMTKFEDWEYDLAARIGNSNGRISSVDIANYNSVLAGIVTMESYFTYNQTV